MKKLFVTMMGAVAMFGISIGVNLGVNGVAEANPIAQNLCTYVDGDDRLRMRQRLREDRVQLRRVYDGVLCNGLTLLQFAMQVGSDDIGEFIVSQLPGSMIESSGDLEWAESNGHGDSAIANAMRDRIGN